MSLKEEFADILDSNIEGMTREEAEYYIDNDAIPSIGSVGGLIYYSETESLAKNYYEEMVDAVKNAFGDGEMPATLNDLCWTAWAAILPELKEEALSRRILQIVVPRSVFLALTQRTKPIGVPFREYISAVSKTTASIDTDIIVDVEEFYNDVKQYAWIKHQDRRDDVHDACAELEEAYDNGESEVEIVSKFDLPEPVFLYGKFVVNELTGEIAKVKVCTNTYEVNSVFGDSPDISGKDSIEVSIENDDERLGFLRVSKVEDAWLVDYQDIGKCNRLAEYIGLQPIGV